MNENEQEIDLREFFRSFWNKKGWIISITLLFAVIGAVYSMMFVTPKYTATTTLVLASNSGESGESITSGELTLNNSLVSTYRELAKSESVLNQVTENLRLRNITAASIRKNLEVSSVSGTQILKVSVTSENPEYAERITNETATVFIEKVQDIYKIENIKVVDPAKTPTSPSNINHTKDVLKFAGIGLVLGFLVVFFTNFFDTTIKTKEDIEGQFKLHVLATLPKYETAMQKVDKKHSKGREQ